MAWLEISQSCTAVPGFSYLNLLLFFLLFTPVKLVSSQNVLLAYSPFSLSQMISLVLLISCGQLLRGQPKSI